MLQIPPKKNVFSVAHGLFLGAIFSINRPSGPPLPLGSALRVPAVPVRLHQIRLPQPTRDGSRRKARQSLGSPWDQWKTPWDPHGGHWMKNDPSFFVAKMTGQNHVKNKLFAPAMISLIQYHYDLYFRSCCGCHYPWKIWGYQNRPRIPLGRCHQMSLGRPELCFFCHWLSSEMQSAKVSPKSFLYQIFFQPTNISWVSHQPQLAVMAGGFKQVMGDLPSPQWLNHAIFYTSRPRWPGHHLHLFPVGGMAATHRGALDAASARALHHSRRRLRAQLEVTVGIEEWPPW